MRAISLLPMLAMGLFFFAGCANQRVPEGKLKTEGVTITCDDPRFTLKAGEIFTPPFEVDTFSQVGKWDFGNLVEKYDEALAIGARRVSVTVPEHKEPMYGVLLLSTVKPDAKVAAARSYLIEVPPNYVDAAQDGQISVIYEKLPYDEKQEWFTWALWISDRPFRTAKQ